MGNGAVHAREGAVGPHRTQGLGEGAEWLHTRDRSGLHTARQGRDGAAECG